jgi:hypothetical protein
VQDDNLIAEVSAASLIRKEEGNIVKIKMNALEKNCQGKKQ